MDDFAGDDVPFEYAASVFKKLKGVKRLIVGNHDGDAIRGLPWASVDVMRTLVGPGCKIVFAITRCVTGMGSIVVTSIFMVTATAVCLPVVKAGIAVWTVKI